MKAQTSSQTKRKRTNLVNASRKDCGAYYTLYLTCLVHDEDEFQKYLRMKPQTFKYIYCKVKAKLKKNWCNVHKRAVFEEEQLVITLRFLATGMTYEELHFAFMIAPATASSIVKRTLKILWEVLQPVHLGRVSKERFLKNARDFFKRTGLPHVIGALDGRLVPIEKPPHTGSLHYCYKKFYAIPLQAVVDSNRRYLFIDVGGYGSQSDGGTFAASLFYKALQLNKLEIPAPSKLPNSNIIAPYYFVADGAYPLMENIMKPFQGNGRSEEEQYFNTKICSARVAVEHAFGFSCKKWHILKTTINKRPDLVVEIVKVACLLHNVIIDVEKVKFGFLNFSKHDKLSRLSKDHLKAAARGFRFGRAREIREDLVEFMAETK